MRAEDSPAAIGPYSQAVASGGLVFTSGQIPLDPKSGEIVGGGIENQARRTLDNLEAVLRAARSSLADALQVTVYLTSLSNFATVNEIYAERLKGSAPPARVCVEVAALPKNALIEISAIAARKGSDA